MYVALSPAKYNRICRRHMKLFLTILESTEYVDYLFQLESKFGTPNLSTFGDLSNKEMMWVITEIVLEMSVRNRAKLIKEFIKVKYILDSNIIRQPCILGGGD